MFAGIVAEVGSAVTGLNSANVEIVRSLGVDDVIDYIVDDFAMKRPDL